MLLPSLHAHYKHFNTTTEQSATDMDFGTCQPCLQLSAFPFAFHVCFPRSIIEPMQQSCHLYTACPDAIDRLLHQLSPVPSDTDFRHDFLRVNGTSRMVHFGSTLIHTSLQRSPPQRFHMQQLAEGLMPMPAHRHRETFSHLYDSYGSHLYWRVANPHI